MHAFWVGLVMSNVFLAYKTADAERVKVVREKLELLGIPLFIDQKMLSGDNYISTINEELNSALAVLVLWTEAAVRMPGPGDPPNFVLSEAQRGYARGILVAATFERMALDYLPVPFNLFQAPDLSGWLLANAPAKHPEWQKVLQALGKKLNRPGLGDLAIAIECDDYDFLKKFLREHLSDPSAKQVAARLEARERKAFETRFSTAKRRIQQRVKDAEKRLASYRDQFEAHLVQLRTGEDFMFQLDPLEALDDDDITQKLEYERIRADQAEDLIAKANREIAELKDRCAGSAAALDAQNATIKNFNSELAKRHGQISVPKVTLASQGTGSERRRQGETKRLVLWAAAAAVAAALVFGPVGMLMAPSASGVAELNAQLAALSAQNQSLVARAKTLETRTDEVATKSASDTDAKIAGLNAQNQALQSQVAQLKGQLNDDATSATTFKSKISDLTTQNQTLQSQVAQLKGQLNDDATSATTFKSKISDLTTQNQTLQKLVSDLQASAAAQITTGVIPLNSLRDAPVLKNFVARNNSDIDGNDIPNSSGRIGIQVENINECALRCTATPSCLALSFDRWKNYCYLKDNVTRSILDVTSTIAVKRPLQLPSALAVQTKIEVIRNRRLRGDLAGRSADASFDACKAKCDEDRRCLGFNFAKQSTATTPCEMFNFLDGYDPDNTMDGGYKIQAAQ